MNKVMKIFLTSSLVLGIGFANTSVSSVGLAAASVQTQSDYVNHPYKNSIDYVLKNHLMWSNPDGSFKPDQAITQADLVVSLVALKSLKQGGQVPELPTNFWAKKQYEMAKQDGILTGVTIAPAKVISREEAASLLINAWETYGHTRTYKNSNSYKGWSEVQYLGSRKWLPEKPGKFPNGNPTTKFDAFGVVTRAQLSHALKEMHQERLDYEAAQILMERVHNSLKVVNGVLTGSIPDSATLKTRISIRMKDMDMKEIEQGKFSVNISNAKYMQIHIVRKGESVDLSGYMYSSLPSLVRQDIRR